MQKFYFTILFILLLSSCMSRSDMINQTIQMQIEAQKKMDDQIYGDISDADLAMDIINETTLQKVIEINLNKDDLNNRILTWIDETFTDQEDTINEKENYLNKWKW